MSTELVLPAIVESQQVIDFGSSSDAFLFGEADILGGDGVDVLIGGDDGEIIGGRRGDDVLLGGGGDDAVFGGFGDDVIIGGTGDDVLAGNAGADVLLGGSGDDVLRAAGADATAPPVFVTGAIDPFRDLRGPGTLLGGAGNDVLFGSVDDDALAGGAGQDSLLGGRGDDILSGGAGDDVVAGGSGFDKIMLGDGADTLVYSRFEAFFNSSGFTMVETPGTDVVLDFNTEEDTLDLRLTEMTSFDEFLAAARDTSFGMQIFFGGQDVLKLQGVSVADIREGNLLLADPNAVAVVPGGEASSAIGGDDDDTFRAGQFGDRMNGGRGDDVLLGDANDDALFGGDGDDRLIGADGDDILNGGEGLNVLIGGQGADIFVFHDFPNDGVGVSVVKDFDASEDVLSFARIGFESLDDVIAATRETTYGIQIALGDGAFVKLIGVGIDDLNDGNVIPSANITLIG